MRHRFKTPGVENPDTRPCGKTKLWKALRRFRSPIARTIEAWRKPVSIGVRSAPEGAPHHRPHDGPRSASFDDGGIAVRAHRHHPWGMCDSHPLRIRPRRPKRQDWTATGEPGPQDLTLAGGARTQSGTGPNGDRALGRGGVGEKGVREARKALRTASGHGRNAGRSTALRVANGICRRGLRNAHRQGLRAFGSGHCLQSRISHDSFLVGYDWWIELWVLRWSGSGAFWRFRMTVYHDLCGDVAGPGRVTGPCRTGPLR